MWEDPDHGYGSESDDDDEDEEDEVEVAATSEYDELVKGRACLHSICLFNFLTQFPR